MKRRYSPRAVRCLESSWRPAFSGDTESVRLETEVGRTETVLSFHTTSCFRDLPFLAPIRRSNALIAGKKAIRLHTFHKVQCWVLTRPRNFQVKLRQLWFQWGTVEVHFPKEDSSIESQVGDSAHGCRCRPGRLIAYVQLLSCRIFPRVSDLALAFKAAGCMKTLLWIAPGVRFWPWDEKSRHERLLKQWM